jgi:transposase
MTDSQLLMPKTTGISNTTPELRALITQKANEGVSISDIAAFTNTSRWTVYRALKNYKERGSHNDAPRCGRPSKVNERAARHIKLTLERNRHQSLTDITSFVNNSISPPISTKTVKRFLYDTLDMHGCIAAKKPFLKKVHKQARCKWAAAYRGWSEEDWHHVIWTDEASVEIGHDSRRALVWRRPGERYDEKCILPTFKSGRQSLMIWGCMAYGRLGPLVRIPKEERTGADYVKLVLGGPLWDFYSGLYEERGMVAVMEDGAPTHRSKAAKDFRATHQLEVLPHPAQSPDLNPIEHVWRRLKVRINQRPIIPKDVEEMWVALQEEWGKIEVEFINQLANSMPECVEAVRKVRGGHTKY